MPVSVVGQGRLFDPGALLRSVRMARDFRPHIVHGAVFEGLSLAVVAGRGCGAKVVIEETSLATNRSRKGHALFRALVAASDACVAISPAVRDYLSDVTGVPRGKITLITNGVAPPALPTPAAAAELRAQLGIGADTFVVGTVARLQDDQHKRVSDLVRALALMSKQASVCHLLVVGDGGERPKLEALAESLGVRQQVSFCGHRDDVGNFYAIMDAFALVSGREGFGLVIAEAMFCGLPVVGSNIGGIRDIVVHGETGMLVPVFDPAAIAAALVDLQADAHRRQALGQAGRLRAESHFGAERYAADVDAFYSRLLSSAKHRRGH
jgi:glycosyltransferase involved in cell wall biosynthesis